jgi:hypothetical protein
VMPFAEAIKAMEVMDIIRKQRGKVPRDHD